jgi:hypothetical protein
MSCHSKQTLLARDSAVFQRISRKLDRDFAASSLAVPI